MVKQGLFIKDFVILSIMIKLILRLEGAALFLTSLYFYYLFQGNWLIFVLLLFTPDISMLGYLKDKKLGAYIYNTVHNYLLGIAIILLGTVLKDNLIRSVGIILIAHIALDRFLGFGLKYISGFKDTHLQKV